MDRTTFNNSDDENANEALNEVEAIFGEFVDRLDTNNDGKIDADELAAADALTEKDEAAANAALDQAQAAAAEHLGDLQRLQAEYVNYRKRVDRDRAAAGEVATARVIEALFPVLDDISAAREHGDLAEGPFAAIATKLEATLGHFGWTSFGEVGEPFNPVLHEALLSQPSATVTEPTVQTVAQPGHRVGERVLRPARVVVATPE